MKYLVVILALLLSACGEGTHILSYEELVHYRTSCTAKEFQLKQLLYIQRVKNFNPDPDQLNEDDRAYNSRLKATIWWYAYSCGEQ